MPRDTPPARTSKPVKRPSLDTPFGETRFPTAAPAADSKTPAPDSLGATIEGFANAVARSADKASSVPPSHDPPAELEDLLIEMRAGLAAKDHARALAAARAALVLKPGLPVAVMCRREASRRLEAEYLARIGPVSQVLRVSTRTIERAALDAPARFVLSIVDGHATITEIVVRSCLDRLVALRIVDDLLGRGILERR